MLKKLTLLTFLCSSVATQANLISLDQQEMTNTVGQGGADLSWTLSLNHQYATDLSLTELSTTDINNITTVFYQLDKNSCGTDNLFCRLAISLNNHEDNQGNKKWLVFKDIQGTVQIDKFSIDGTTLISNGRPQSALQVTFYDDHPLKIRNLGFSTLSVETGYTEKDAAGQPTNKVEGYLNSSKYDTYDEVLNGVTTPNKVVPKFDHGQEKGFMGLNMHGNLHMSGKLKIFSYNCSGGSQGRC